MVEIFFKFLRFERPLLLVLGLVVCWSAAQLSSVDFSEDYRIYFDHDNPELTVYQRIQKVFSKDDMVVFGLSDKENIYNINTIKAIKDLTSGSWKLPHAVRVESLTNYHIASGTEDVIEVNPLLSSSDPITKQSANRLRAIAHSESAINGRLVSRDGKMALVFVHILLPDGSRNETKNIALAVESLKRRISSAYKVNLFSSGSILLSHGFNKATRSDLVNLTPFVFAVVGFFVFISLRCSLSTLSVCLIVSFVTICSLGLVAHFQVPLSAPSAAAFTVIMALTVADSIHVVNSYFIYLRNLQSPSSAIRSSLKDNFSPIFLTSLTTIFGFLGLNLSNSAPFRHLGNISAMGVGLAFVFSVTILPFLLKSLVKTPPKVSHKAAIKVFGRISGGSQKAPFAIILIFSVVSLISIQQIFGLVVDDDQVRYLGKQTEFRKDTETIMNSIGGVHRLDVSVDSGFEGGVNSPEYLKTISKFSHWAMNSEYVVHSYDVSGIYKEMNEIIMGESHSLPSTKNANAQFMMLYEMSLPPGSDLTDRVNLDKSASKITLLLRDLSTTGINKAAQQIEKWFENHAPNLQVVGPAGASLMFARIFENNIKQLLVGTFVVLFLVTLLLAFVFKSWKYAFISIVPNAMPALWCFGVWGLIGEPIGLSAATISTFTMGIIVDDTIHFMTHYIRKIRQGSTVSQALEHTFVHVGPALTKTTIGLVAGFLFLGTSAFKLNTTLGILTAITISFALLADLILLPALLYVVDSKESRHGS